MASTIRFVLANFTLTFLVVGLIASAVALIRSPKPLTTPVVVEALFAYFLLFSIGFSLFYNFVLHTFFGEMSASFIGWKNSPFPGGGWLRQPGIRGCGFSGFPAQLRTSACRSNRTIVVSSMRGRGARLSDYYRPQFRPRKCRGDPLYGLFDSRDRFPAAGAATPV